MMSKYIYQKVEEHVKNSKLKVTSHVINCMKNKQRLKCSNKKKCFSRKAAQLTARHISYRSMRNIWIEAMINSNTRHDLSASSFPLSD